MPAASTTGLEHEARLLGGRCAQGSGPRETLRTARGLILGAHIARRLRRRAGVGPLALTVLALTVLTVLAASGCAAKAVHTGLVRGPHDAAELESMDGRTLRLAAAEGNDPVLFLEGCEVEVSGARIGRRLVVASWTIVSSEAGGQPFVGVLHRHGGNWLLDDRTTGSTLVLDPDTMNGLEEHDGHWVMVDGFVAGAHQVRIVRWRALYEVEEEAD